MEYSCNNVLILNLIYSINMKALGKEQGFVKKNLKSIDFMRQKVVSKNLIIAF